MGRRKAHRARRGGQERQDMLTSRENFFQMMRHERPQWLPFDLPATPPVLDMIESKTGTRDVVKAFGTDFCGCGPTFPVDPACWSDAFEALGFPVPANAEIGVDILNPVQPECMPVVEVIAQHKHHLAFWGMIGTQTTMPFGSPDDVRAAVAGCARYVQEGAAVIVASTHVLEPDVPWENIQALVKAMRGARRLLK